MPDSVDPSRGAAAYPSLLERRLIIVTGKGGVGKTTIASALAEAARRADRRVLLVETADSEAAASFFEASPDPIGHAGRPLAPNLHALRIDPHEALAEYVRTQTHLGLLTDRLLQTEVFRQLLAAAPGWRELILLGKIWHLEQKKDPGAASQASPKKTKPTPLYDLIIVDAPATGHGLTFLDVPRVVQQAVRAGPLARHAGWVDALVHDPKRTLLLPVTVAEELPVLETRELVERARREIGIAVDRIVVNQSPSFETLGLDTAIERLPDDLSLETLPAVPALRWIAERAARQQLSARRFRRRVAADCGLPIVDFPLLAEALVPQAGATGRLAWLDFADRILASPTWPEHDDADSDRLRLADREGVSAA